MIKLTKPSASFLGALSLSSFGIASPKALTDYGADQGKVDADGVFHPTGTFGTEHPIGTGPFKFDSWTRGDKLTLLKYDDYWGEKAKIDKLIFRPIADNAARLQALQSGEIQGYDLVEPQDVDTIKGDSNLQILDRPAFNVGYVGINQDFKPFDNPKVRHGGRLRTRPASCRRLVLRRPWSRGERVHAARGGRLQRRRHEVHVRPGKGEVAAHSRPASRCR